MGEFFAQKNNAGLAVNEFKKALQENPKDLLSRANIIYIDIQTGNREEAASELEILKTQDATLSAKLEVLLKQK